MQYAATCRFYDSVRLAKTIDSHSGRRRSAKTQEEETEALRTVNYFSQVYVPKQAAAQADLNAQLTPGQIADETKAIADPDLNFEKCLQDAERKVQKATGKASAQRRKAYRLELKQHNTMTVAFLVAAV
jgi:hypothetical protein